MYKLYNLSKYNPALYSTYLMYNPVLNTGWYLHSDTLADLEVLECKDDPYEGWPAPTFTSIIENLKDETGRDLTIAEAENCFIDSFKSKQDLCDYVRTLYLLEA